jgi:hypothetical protein
MKRIMLSACVAILAAAPIAGQSVDRYLIPIMSNPTEGAGGSLFVTELVLMNKGTVGIQLRSIREACQITCTPDSDTALPLDPGEARSYLEMEGTPGRFFYVASNDATHVSGNLRVADVSRLRENLGTELPIVHESAFAPEVYLVNVPAGTTARHTLRIYATEPTTVRVQYYPVLGSELIGEELVTLIRPASGNDADDRGRPFFAQIPEFPPLTGDDRLHAYRVRLSSETGEPLWAFVSITNNATQLITTVTPQPEGAQ